MVFPPELVEMVQELWDRGVALHPAVMVSFIYTYKLLTGCLGIMAHNRPMPRAQPEAEVDYESHNS